MAEGGSRPHWRDVGVLVVLAVLLVGGLVHYGRDLSEPAATTGDKPSASPPRVPRRSSRARRRPIRAQPAPPSGGTCWDGRPTTDALAVRPARRRPRPVVGVPVVRRGPGVVPQGEPQQRQLPRGRVVRVLPACARPAGDDHLRPGRGRRPGRAVAADADRCGEPPDGARRPGRPMHLPRRREPARPDHRDVRQVPLRRLGLRASAPRPRRRPGARSSGSARRRRCVGCASSGCVLARVPWTPHRGSPRRPPWAPRR